MSTQDLPDSKEKELLKLVEYLQKVINDNIDILNMSKGKDIVVVLGNTGSGKSTTLDMLAGKELIVGDYDSIVLKNESDPTAMKIGDKGESMTKCPFSIKIGDHLFIDLPGFRDSGGMACDLANAAFIKAILEKANSVKVMLFVSEDEVTASRGEFLKGLLTGARNMFGKEGQLLLDSSLLVVTKSSRNNVDELGEFLLQQTPPQYHDQLNNWKYKKTLFQIKRPIGGQICQDGKTEILRVLSSSSGQKVNQINIDAIYPSGVEAELSNIFVVMFEQELKSFIPKPDKKLLSSISSSINAVKGNPESDDHFRAFWCRFTAYLESINAVIVLKPLSETTFNTALKTFQDSKFGALCAIVSEWESQYDLLSKEIRDENVSRIQHVCEEQLMNQRGDYAFDGVKDISSAEKLLKSLGEALNADMKSVLIDAIKNDSELAAIVERDPDFNKKIFDDVVREFSESDLAKIMKDYERELQQNIDLCETKIKELKAQEETVKAKIEAALSEKEKERQRAELVNVQREIEYWKARPPQIIYVRRGGCSIQ